MAIETINKRLTNVRALKQLHKFFQENPDVNLKMRHYMDILGDVSSSSPTVVEHRCGTSACAVGWAPTAGLTEHIDTTIQDGGGWKTYSNKTFFNKKAMQEYGLNFEAEGLWSFMFGAGWQDDIDHLLARLEYVIVFDRVRDGWYACPDGSSSSPSHWTAEQLRAAILKEAVR